ncbi:MAG TPA: serine hydrolase, partial [Bacteroidales bacterium]|nr:serine hydrolase [Bacteroidales bacterium]
ANYSEKRPVKTTSLFNIASCSKAFTAVSVGILVDEGKLKWTDKVTSYFPWFRLADDYITRELTVEDLLCHRSGLGTFYGDLLWYNTTYSDEEVMKRIRFEPITRRFGIEYGYQNIMFLVAGKLIEKVSGQSWSEFVQSRIFTPLGMQETRPSNDELTPGQDVTDGHINNKAIERYDWNAAKSAAGIYSSVDELSLWTMLLNNKGMYKGKRIISESSLKRIFDPHTVMNISESMRNHGISFNLYAMGWRVHDYNGRKILDHDGGMPGYISNVTLVPSEKAAFIILNNSNDGFVNEALKGDLLDILVKGNDYDYISEMNSINNMSKAAEKASMEQREKSRVPGTKPSHEPDAYAGLYRDQSYGDAEVKLEGNSLRITFIPTGKVFTSTMEHWHYDTFKVVFKDEFLTYGLVTFSFDAAGKATGFRIDLPSADFHFWNLDFKKVKS